MIEPSHSSGAASAERGGARPRGDPAAARAADLSCLSGAEPPSSLYVHFPFCRHRCHYCDFSLIPSVDPPTGAWLAALRRDLRNWFALGRWTARPRLRTLFIGGGTPSLLGAEGLIGLRRTLEAYFDLGHEALEWTVESNPNSVGVDMLSAWRECGVTRLSIGVQSFEDAALAWLGRLHDAATARRSVDMAHQAGFDSINVDMIFGLPEEIERNWAAEVEAAIDLNVTHVSAYGLTAERRTPLGLRVERGKVVLPGGERYGREYLEATGHLVGAGYEHYEVSNFALAGNECRHNWQYWNRSAYLGAGPSAHSYLPPHRIWNVYRWDAYRKAILAGGSLRAGIERADGPSALLEEIWLGLRTRAGWRPRRLAMDGDRRAGRTVDRFVEQGWLRRRGDALRATPRGWLRLDALATELVAAVEASRER